MSGAKATLAPLTSVRFLAALRVALYHFVSWESRTFWWRGLMLTPISVSYFFVSSGFLLAYNYSERVDRREMNYQRYFLGRCARLLPVYYLGLLVALPLLFWPSPNFSFGKSALTFFLVQAWWPHSALYWNGPAWALSCLAFFYVSLPILLVLTRSISKRACVSLAAFAWCVSVALPLAYMYWSPDGLRDIHSQTKGYWLYVLKFNPLVRLPEFFLGIMAGKLFLLTGGFKPKASTAVFLIGCALLLSGLLLGDKLPYPIINSGLLAPLLALLVASLASGGLGARLFRPQWFILLGQSSFCLYMFHLPIWKLAHEILLPDKDFSHLTNFLILSGIVAVSLLMYRLVELRATAVLRTLLKLSPTPAGLTKIGVPSVE